MTDFTECYYCDGSGQVLKDGFDLAAGGEVCPECGGTGRKMTPDPRDTDPPRQPTCAERIGEHLASRLENFGALVYLASGRDPATDGGLTSTERDSISQVAEGEGIDLQAPEDDRREEAQQRIYEGPLSVERKILIRVDLSTGGPADWFEVVIDPSDPNEFDRVERITYHFADWFDHAETTLVGPEFDAAREYLEALGIFEEVE